MAGMKVKQTEYLNTKGILAMADHYVTIGRKHEQATAAGGIVVQDTNTGRLVIKAGTVYPAMMRLQLAWFSKIMMSLMVMLTWLL